jgi:FkbM family methyltransferase
MRSIRRSCTAVIVASQKCGFAVLPSAGGDSERAFASLGPALAFGRGDFRSVEPIDVEAEAGCDALKCAVEQATSAQFDWLLLVSAAETLTPDVFLKMQPALRVYDAVWGGAAAATTDGKPPKLERITRLAAQDLPTFFHAALRWWIGPAHFVRPEVASDALRQTDISAWYPSYMLNLWGRGGAYKTAQCLTHFHAPLPQLADADRDWLVQSLETRPVFASIHRGGRALKLPYTGLNPVIEREQMRGLFFEAEELNYLADRLPRGLRIVDIGANTGNHTLFFAAVMEAESVTPIEPLPRAAAAIRAVIAENGLTNVDPSLLGIAVGAREGRLRGIPSATAGLGATHFVLDPAGEVPVVPLDSLSLGAVDFLKIDAEGMEMQVLAGAANLIASQQPLLYIEVVDDGVREFMAWVDGNQYRVEKLFPDKTHCNYLLFPTVSQRGS